MQCYQKVLKNKEIRFCFLAGPYIVGNEGMKLYHGYDGDVFPHSLRVGPASFCRINPLIKFSRLVKS